MISDISTFSIPYHSQSIVYNDDYKNHLYKYPDNHFDLAVVDPPYGLNIVNMNMGVGKSKKCSKLKNRKWSKKDWDKNIPSSEYFRELFRISKNQIIWGGNYFNLPPFKCFIVWDKEINTELSYSDCELAWTSFNKTAKIFKHSVYLDKTDKIHPTKKPIKLYSWIYKNFATEGMKILDTHLGSGTNRVAAYKAKMDFTAFEIDKDYFIDSEIFFKKEISQLTLF